jgi:hypothetical protein
VRVLRVCGAACARTGVPVHAALVLQLAAQAAAGERRRGAQQDAPVHALARQEERLAQLDAEVRDLGVAEHAHGCCCAWLAGSAWRGARAGADPGCASARAVEEAGAAPRARRRGGGAGRGCVGGARGWWDANAARRRGGAAVLV